MKMRNIILSLITVIAGSFASCDTDLPPDPINNGEEEVSISFILSTGAVETKAAGDNYTGSDGTVYTSATEAELSITKVFIAVLDATGTTVKKSFIKNSSDLVAYELTTDKSPESNNFKKAYKITGLSIEPGNYEFLAIANSEITDNELLGCKTYEELKSLVENNKDANGNTAVFNPAKLVKVSELTPVTISDNGTNPVDVVTIPLIQLAAKVQLNLKNLMPKTELPGETVINFDPSEADLEKWDWSEINSGSTNSAYAYTPKYNNPDKKTYMVQMCGCHKNNEPLHNKLYYYNPKTGKYVLVPHNVKVVHIYGAENTPMTVDSVFYELNWELSINSIIINQVETKTDIILKSGDTYANKGKVLKQNLIVENGDISIIDNDYMLTFYTYEKPYYDNEDDSEILRIDLGTTILEKKKKITKRYNISAAHGVFVNESGNAVEGFGNGEKYQYAYVEGALNTEGSSQIFEEMVNPIEIPKNFSIPVNPHTSMDGCNTDGLIHGNIYVLNAKLENVPNAAEIELLWTVVPWANKTVNVPTFD